MQSKMMTLRLYHGRSAAAGQKRVTVVPCTFPKANALVDKWHRHHAKLPGGFAWYCCVAVVGGEVVGTAIAGRPTNRNNDDKQTVEVLRVATDGTPNAPSALLGACARAARSLGARRILTYTLDEESGASLRGAGWERTGDGIRSFFHTGKSRTRAVKRAHHDKEKVRWELFFRKKVVYNEPGEWE